MNSEIVEYSECIRFNRCFREFKIVLLVYYYPGKGGKRTPKKEVKVTPKKEVKKEVIQYVDAGPGPSYSGSKYATISRRDASELGISLDEEDAAVYNIPGHRDTDVSDSEVDVHTSKFPISFKII